MMRNKLNIKISALALILFIVSCLIFLLLLIQYPIYLKADLALIKKWHPHFYNIIYYCIRVIYLAPFITFLILLIFSYQILKNKKKEIFLLSIILFICLVFAEISLRAMGFRPGYTGKYPFFTAVDSIYELHDYKWDEQGIVHFSDSLIPQVNKAVVSSQNISDKNKLEKYIEENDNFDYCGWLLVHDFGTIFTNDSGSLFKDYVLSLQQKSNLDDADSAVLEYVRNPINEEGFKSMAFKKYNSKKKKILLIGDSFTYGMSARPVYNCYADLLLTKGYIVWNPSFPNNDPESYLQIAKKYIPLLKPDVVIVCFYMGNDIMMYERNTVLGRQHFFPTNAGWIKGEEFGCYFDIARQAYDYYCKKATIGRDNFLSSFCSRTSLFSLIYFYFKGIVSDSNFSEIQCSNVQGNSIDFSYNKMLKISEVCKVNSVLHYNLILPDLVQQNQAVSKIKPNDVLKELLFKEIEDLNINDYNSSNADGHFNNNGHEKAALTIKKLIK